MLYICLFVKLLPITVIYMCAWSREITVADGLRLRNHRLAPPFYKALGSSLQLHPEVAPQSRHTSHEPLRFILRLEHAEQMDPV